MDLQIKQWEKDGIVEKSDDILIQMNVLVVPKVNEVEKLVNEDKTIMNRNGISVMMSNINLQDYRTCLDCRSVNKILAAPDPGKISKTLAFNQQKILLSKCELFSKLDLASYYLQLSFDEPKEGELDSRRILGFLNPLTGESYRFKRLPFGLSCAPQYAQYVFDSIISAY
uniref:Reverse transcriptase domain-containing protein n=1 Tax=Strongyloides venezuelensis TaxID=75913 RepID=A0A0K0FBE4_STRVS